MARKANRQPRHSPVPAAQLEAVHGDVTQLVDGERRTVRGVVREPLAMKARWDDPDYVNDRAASARQIVAFRRADTVLTLHARQPNKITRQHLNAVERLRDDFEFSQGAFGSGSLGRLGAGGGGGSHDGPTGLQLAAAQSFRRAMATLGRASGKLLRIAWLVLIAGHTLKAAAADRAVQLTEEEAKGVLLVALDCLHNHYSPATWGARGAPDRTAHACERSVLL